MSELYFCLSLKRLRVGVTYTERGTGEPKSLRKLYRFNVTSPLTITFRHSSVQGVSCVEAQLRNTTNAQILLDKVDFLPQPPFVAEHLSKNLQPEAKGAKACVAVDSILQLVYRLTCPPDAAAKAQEIGGAHARHPRGADGKLRPPAPGDHAAILAGPSRLSDRRPDSSCSVRLGSIGQT